MKAAIWGVNGYLGKHMALLLHSLDWELYGYDLQPSLVIDLPIVYCSVDVVDKSAVEAENTTVDYVFYYSGLTGTLTSIKNYATYINVNEIGFLNVLSSYSRQNPQPHIVFPSTRLVYKGLENIALKEDAQKEFKTVYALSKYAGEQYLQMFYNLYGLTSTVFRIGVPYGNAFSDEYSYGTIGFFLRKASDGELISLYGNGELKRTFTYVEDVCRQILAGALEKTTEFNTFNISGEMFSLKEVAEKISVSYGVGVVHVDWPVEANLLESGDTIFSSEKIEALLDGYVPLLSFDEWLQSIA